MFLILLSLLHASSSLAATHGPSDFFVFETSKPRAQALLATSCREQIAQAMCLVDPADPKQKPEDRPCLPGGAAYTEHFEKLYDQYPPALQKMFCSVRFIFIEKNFEGTAYAGTLRDADGNINGAVVGIRKSVLDENLNLTTWASWKEQLSFGGKTDSYDLSPELPTIEAGTNHNVNDFLYFVITHEFGHIFDFSNNLNAMENCDEKKDEEPECKMAEGSWGAISWLTSKTPKPENDFPLRNSLCFYWCNGNALGTEHIAPVYQGFANTNFLSLYATRQPWDDFADSLAYFLLDEKLAGRYVIQTKRAGLVDILEKLRSPAFAHKRAYIRHFLERPDILYP